jgi:hypothetical protein
MPSGTTFDIFPADILSFLGSLQMMILMVSVEGFIAVAKTARKKNIRRKTNKEV